MASQSLPSRDRRDVLIAAAIPVVILMIGVAIRIAMRPTRDVDELMFLSVGRHLLDSGLPIESSYGPARLFFDHTPLYVYLVALLEAVGGPTTLIARGASLVFGVLTVLLVFRIGLEVHGLGSAFVGAALVAANPFFITYSWFIRMEVPLCLFLVLAVYLLIHERFLLAGLSITVAVMLKEIALAFWLVAVVFVLARRGWRPALSVAFSAPIAIAAWLAYAASIDLAQLLVTLERWGRSSVGTEADNRRFMVPPLVWLNRLLAQVVGTGLTFAAGAAVAVAALRRMPIPAIVVVTTAYCAVAIGSSFLISLKEVRFLIAVVPMLALSIALAVDWGETWTRLRGHSARGT
jgi:4-amino-4-deoxy-L-arabinose transferase-like glycosyltransferase